MRLFQVVLIFLAVHIGEGWIGVDIGILEELYLMMGGVLTAWFARRTMKKHPRGYFLERYHGEW